MRKTDHAMSIDDRNERHTSQLENVDFLLVALRHRMAWIGQADKWKLFRAPIKPEGRRRVRANRQNLCPAAGEFVISISQARQLRAAVGSQKTAQESQDDGPPTIICEPDTTTARVGKLEFGGSLAGLQQLSHRSSIRGLSSRSHRTSARSICRSKYSAGWDDKNIAASGRLSIAIC